MTELESLEKTVLVWTWMKNNLGKTKKQAYRALGLEKDLADCPLCSYASSACEGLNVFLCDGYCPLYGKWGIHGTQPCWFGGNFYSNWATYLSEYLYIVLETKGDLSPSQERRIIVIKHYMEINAGHIIALCKERIREIG